MSFFMKHKAKVQLMLLAAAGRAAANEVEARARKQALEQLKRGQKQLAAGKLDQAETALRAVRRCAPYNIPPKFAPFYADWKRWYVEFDVVS